VHQITDEGKSVVIRLQRAARDMQATVPSRQWRRGIAKEGAMRSRQTLELILLVAAGALCATSFVADAQQPDRCRIVCVPTMTVMPSVQHTHLFGGPLVEDLKTGARHRLPSSSNTEIIVVAAAKTAVPRLHGFMSVQWLPNAGEARNPYTLYTANELGGRLRANAPTATAGVFADAVTVNETNGWADLSVVVGDLYSQAARPSDRSSYTQKLDLELLAQLHAFAWTPPATYVHRISVFAILDYVATGLPRKGDEVPQGRLFLEHAKPTALIAGLALPITPAVK
jgi:hypothetical protein